MHGGYGNFRVDGLIPGGYSVIAIAGEGPSLAFGKVPVSVTTHDMNDVMVRLSPAPALTGSVRATEPNIPIPNGLEVKLLPTGRWGNGWKTGPVAVQDERFNFAGVLPAAYWPELSGLPSGWALARVLIGTQDTFREPIAIDASSDITFIISSRAGAVSVTVRDANLNRMAGVRITLRPEAIGANPDPLCLRTAETDASGRFLFTDVSPGKYRIDGVVVEVRASETEDVVITK
jgi:hypothetical protein